MNDVGYIDPNIVNGMSADDRQKFSEHLHELRMERCRQDFISYVRYVDPKYEVADFHRTILQSMQSVAEELKDRVLLTMPPRHGKSHAISELYPAWLMGRQPDIQIIACSYAGELAATFGRKARDLIASPEHRDVFPNSELSSDSKSAHRWNTPEGGAYYAAGVGGPITGRGADIILLDDLIKNREEADSQAYRDKVWDWYKEVLYTRLHTGGRIIALMTRWHEDDLIGRLLHPPEDDTLFVDPEELDDWEHIHFPAINDKGEALWPSKFPVGKLSQIRATIGRRGWQALYQNDPQPDEGNFFKRDWFKYYKKIPMNLRIFGASDYAVTADGGDYTVHSVIGVDEEDNIYLLDVWRGQTDTLEWVEELLRLMKMWGPYVWIEEGGAIQKSMGGIITKRMSEEKIYIHRAAFPSTRDKASRARSMQGRIQMGKVFFPKTKWFEPLQNEMLTFPLGKHDDFVDTMSLFGQHLPGLKAAAPIKPKPKLPPKTYVVPGKPYAPTFDELAQKQILSERARRENRWGV